MIRIGTMTQRTAVCAIASGLLMGMALQAQAQNSGQSPTSGAGTSSGRNGNFGGQSSTSTNPNSTTSQPTMPGLGNSNNDEMPSNPRTLADMEKMRNVERQRKLMADTDKLLALATQLKADMDKTNKDMLSVDVIRKADEIEKLAKTVKDRMKGS